VPSKWQCCLCDRRTRNWNLIICWIISGPVNLIARARRVSEILRREQEPFWLTGGNGIALSSLGITPPPGANWCENSIRPDKFLNDLCGYVFNIKWLARRRFASG
jgi:hypothetical protein